MLISESLLLCPWHCCVWHSAALVFTEVVYCKLGLLRKFSCSNALETFREEIKDKNLVPC